MTLLYPSPLTSPAADTEQPNSSRTFSPVAVQFGVDKSPDELP